MHWHNSQTDKIEYHNLSKSKPGLGIEDSQGSLNKSLKVIGFAL